MARKRNSNKMSKLEIGAGLFGMLCPIPILGEASLAYFLNKPITQAGLVKGAAAPIASLAIAALTRASFYQPVYIPILNFLGKTADYASSFL